jgi:hypothetical protein
LNKKIIDAKIAKTPLFLKINPGGSKISISGWFQIETDSLSGEIGSIEEESVSLVMSGNNSKTDFSYCYDYTDVEAQALTEDDLIKNYFID